MGYAIIRVGGKQHRVTAGEWLLVDRLALDEGATFNPEVLLTGGDGATDLAPGASSVTARVLSHEKGVKIRIGKYRRRKNYRRHNGFRASLTKIQIESIGGVAAAPKAAKKAAVAAAAPAETKEAENGA